MPDATKTRDQAHLLPPDKFSDLTKVVFATWNSPFKVMSVKRELNSNYTVVVELKTGTRQTVTV